MADKKWPDCIPRIRKTVLHVMIVRLYVMDMIIFHRIVDIIIYVAQIGNSIQIYDFPLVSKLHEICWKFEGKPIHHSWSTWFTTFNNKNNNILLNKFIDNIYLLVSYIYRRFYSFGSKKWYISLFNSFSVFYNDIINGFGNIQFQFKIDLYSLVCARTDGNTRRKTIRSFEDSIFYPVSDNKTKIVISTSWINLKMETRPSARFRTCKVKEFWIPCVS